jgi:hypothetical protein
MAKIVTKTLGWIAPGDADLVSHKVYVDTGATLPTYDSQNVIVPMPATSLELPYGFAGMPLVDGTYNFGISAVDDFGNESDITHISADLDFLAPSPPTGLYIS